MRLVLTDREVDMWPFALFILAVALGIVWYRTRSLPYLLCCAVFGIYLLCALAPVLFPIYLSGHTAEDMRSRPFEQFVNLNPFDIGHPDSYEFAMRVMLQNILLTIPFGFGMNFIAQVQPRQALWVAAVVGLSTEGLQLLISLFVGYFHRALDANDVLMNALGVLVGYGVFRVLAWLYQRMTNLRPADRTA